MISHNSNNNSHLGETDISGKAHPPNVDSQPETASGLENTNDDRSNGAGFRHFQEGQIKQGDVDDSGQTVLSFSPPLEVFAASTIEHQLLDPFDTLLKSGMLAQGTQLAHFIIDKYIGGGGMGRVYLGTDQALDRKVALKVLPMQRAHDHASVARFMNEAKSAARLNHEHIAQVYFAGEQSGIPFIAFEYVQGTNIRTYVEQYGVIPLPQTINYLLQISHALAHAATHQVIHRDVKPSNILITAAGRAKLIDMGLARLLTHSNLDNDLTASGVTLGTFDYISPEQARDPRNADTRSDIYSLGCTFFFMLTGRPPFSEGTVLQKLLQHQGDVPPDVRDFQPNTPIQVSQIIQKMMAKDPKVRYQTASELVDDLTEVAKMIGLRPVDTGSLVWQLPLKRRFQPILRHLPWLLPLFLFFVFFIFVKTGMIFAPTPNSGPPYIESVFQNGSSAGGSGKQSPTPGSPGGIGSAEIKEQDTAIATVLTLPLTLRQGDGLPEHFLSFFWPSELFGFETMNSDHPSTFENTETTHDSRAIRLKRTQMAAEIEPMQVNALTWPEISVGYRAGVSRQSDNSFTGSGNQAPTKLIVDPTGQLTNSYKSLTDAARVAAKDATIELYSSEPIEIVHFRFTESRATIKSGDGGRVKLIFRPSASVMFTGTSSMAALTNSDMKFENVDIEMIIPQSIDAIADRWTMFELIGLNMVELRNVVLTINNAQRDRAYQEKNAFFRCSPMPAIYVVPSSYPDQSAQLVTKTALTIRDSLIRGEASLLRCDNSLGVQVHSDNVLIATNQPVFSLLDIKPSGMASERNIILTDFRHNTIYAPTMVSWQPGVVGSTIGHSIELSFVDSIVWFRTVGTMADYAGGIAFLPDISGFYSRKSTRTFYQNFMHESRIRPVQSGESLREISPNESREDQQRYFDTVYWNMPYLGNMALHDLTKNNFLLDETSGRNAAINLNGPNAGINPELIPDPTRSEF